MSITSISSLPPDPRSQSLAAPPGKADSALPAAQDATATPALQASPAITAPQTESQTGSPIEQVQQALDEVRKAITPVAQDLLFSIDEDTGKTIVRVVDASTDEVIRQIPSEEIISIAKALDKLQGLLIQQKA